MVSKLVFSYKNLAAPVKASLWFTVSSIIQRGISLISTPIFTRLLTTEQYGVYAVYQSWYSVVIIFATLNLFSGVYNNGMTKWPDDRQRFTSAMQGLSTTITIALFFVYFIAQDFWNRVTGLSSLYVFAMFIEILFVPAFNYWSAGQRYDYKYRKLVGLTVAMGISSPVLGIITVLLTEYKAEARVISFVFVQICVGLIFYIYNFYKGKTYFIKQYWIFALRFNLPLIPHYLSQTVLSQADRIMISNMVGSGEAAIYSVAHTISMMFTIVTNAINNTFIPYTYKQLKEKKYEGLKRNATYLVLIVSAACIIAIAFGPEIIRIFAAPEYYEARWVVPPVAEALLFMFLFPLFCNIEFYYEKTKFIMVASSLAACANIVLNYLGISRLGYIAAAYTTLICYIVLSIAHYFAYKVTCKKNGIDIELYDIRLIMLICLVSLVMMGVMISIYDNHLLRYTVVLILAIVTVFCRKYILQIFKDIKNK